MNACPVCKLPIAASRAHECPGPSDWAARYDARRRRRDAELPTIATTERLMKEQETDLSGVLKQQEKDG